METRWLDLWTVNGDNRQASLHFLFAKIWSFAFEAMCKQMNEKSGKNANRKNVKLFCFERVTWARSSKTQRIHQIKINHLSFNVFRLFLPRSLECSVDAVCIAALSVSIRHCYLVHLLCFVMLEKKRRDVLRAKGKANTAHKDREKMKCKVQTWNDTKVHCFLFSFSLALENNHE